MKEKIKKNQGYLFKRPENSLCCFILVSPNDLKGFTEEQHKKVEELKNNGYDLFFIFLPNDNSLGHSLSRIKFTSLEEAKGMIELASLPEIGWVDILKGIDYVTQTTPGFYTGYTLVSMSDLETEENLVDKMNSLQNINRLDISLPVLEISRQEWEVLKEGWRWIERDNKSKNKGWFWKGTVIEDDEEEFKYQSGMFATHTSKTLFPFYRPQFFTDLLKTFEEPEKYGFISTFPISTDSRVVISSLIKFYGMGWLDRDPMNIDLKKQKI